MPAAATIVFTDEPVGSDGRYVHYDHRRITAPGWDARDIRAVVAENQEKWLGELEEWHRCLSSRAAQLTEGWWLVPGSRLAAWYPVNLKPLLFAVGVIELCRQEPGAALNVVKCPPEVKVYLEEWQAGNLPGAVVIRGSKEDTGTPPNDSGCAGNRQAWREMGSLIRRRLGRGRLPSAVGPAEVIVVSQTLNARLLEEVGDHFFGKMLDDPSLISGCGLIWLYRLSSFAERSAARQACESNGRRCVFDFELIGWSEILDTARGARHISGKLAALSRELPTLRVGGLRSRAFPAHYFAGSVLGALPLSELATYHATKKLLRHTNAKIVVYAYEEKGYERAILRACSERGGVVRSIGFAHAAYNRGHIYLRRGGKGEPPRPDLLAITGPRTRGWLMGSNNVAADEAMVVGSPRHRIPIPLEPVPGARLRVLFLSGYGYETGNLVSLLEDAPDLLARHEFLIRPYPHGWQTEQQRAVARLRALGPNVRIENGDLVEQIRWAKLTLFASTSAALEAILRGRLAVRVGLHDVFDADPTNRAGDACGIPFCRDADDLCAVLERVAGMTPDEYRTMLERQRRFAEGVYSPPDHDALQRLLGAEIRDNGMEAAPSAKWPGIETG